MKRIIILSLIVLQTIPTLFAQNRPDSTKIEFQGLSRHEIRRQFLSSGETSEFYNLALKSKKFDRQSIRSFVVGGLFVAGGIYGLVEASNRPKGIPLFNERSAINLLAVLSFGLSIPLIVRGVNKKKDSKHFLDEAINGYMQK